MTTLEFNTVIGTLCRMYDGSITSTHRTIDHNRVVGGAPDSQHLEWKAVDVVLDNWRVKDTVILYAKQLGLFVLDETASKNHLHIDDRFNA
jgi:uncharacterized protein YcbK (DUF882 family)